MQYRNHTPFVILVALMLAITACRDQNPNPIPIAGADDAIITVQELSIESMRDDSGRDMAIMATGIDMLAGESAEFQSPIITSNTPFDYVVPEWSVELPEGSEFTIHLRTSTLEGAWGDWKQVEINPDTTEPLTNNFSGNMIGVGMPETLHDRVQIAVDFFPNEAGELPTLANMAVVFIDSSGPTTEELIDTGALTGSSLQNQLGSILPQAEPPAEDIIVVDDAVAASAAVAAESEPAAEADVREAGTPRPNIITRAQWCTHADCNYDSAELNYEPVTHLIVHHTVSDNSITDWAGNVRAIWTYHTFRQDWGDIGYNYLIDPNGTIYEGHLGGDNVIGTHAADANTGSMGVALLGTFSTSDPTPAMVNSLVNLLAWKADQRNIDLWDASRLPELNWGHLHLIGHRDVYGTTACPGTEAHGMLAEVRQRVSDKIGQVPDYVYLDDLHPSFSLSDANWHEGPNNCGFNAHSYFTYSTTNASIAVNQGEWRPDVEIAGRYEVDAFVPFCRTESADTEQAPYTVVDALATHTFTRNQEANLGLWMPLGEFNFTPGQENVIRLGDLTSSEDNLPIWYDAIRLRLLEVGAINQQPSADQWVTSRDVTFSWQLSASSSVSELRLQVSEDPSFNNRIVDRTVSASTRSVVHGFDRDFANLYWRMVATTFGGRVVVSDATNFHIDATPPTSQIHTAFKQCDGSFKLFWDGSDNLSNVAHYDIQFKREFDSAWTTLLNDTTLTEFAFMPDSDDAYSFRAQATDGRGNVEPAKPNGDIGPGAIIPCEIAPPANQSPSSDALLNNRTVRFSWNIELPAAVETYRLQVATDAAFSAIVAEQTMNGSVQSADLTLDQDYPQLFWRVTATSLLGRTFTSSATAFALDATAPESTVIDTWQLENGDYILFWEGSDNQSGLTGYTVEFLSTSNSSWIPVLVNTQATQATFRPPNLDSGYVFRSRAIDAAGNMEQVSAAGDFDAADGCPYIGTSADLRVPSADAWVSNDLVTFRWGTTKLRCITSGELEISRNASFSSIVHRETFDTARSAFTYRFSDPVDQYFWRVTQTTVLDEAFTATPVQFGFDRTPPSSQIVAVRELPSGQFEVEAAGSDGQSGIQAYIFEYRAANSSRWLRWSVGASETAVFSPSEADTVYWFRSLAIDAAGNIEPADSNGDLSTADALPTLKLWFPIMTR